MKLFIKAAWQFLLIASRVLIFIILFVIAASNTQQVAFNWFPGQSLEIPLILLLLLTFLLGIGITSIAAWIRSKKANK